MRRQHWTRGLLIFALVVAGLAPAAARADSVGSWSPAPPMLVARSSAAAARLSDGRVLVAGGRTAENHRLTSAELYDPGQNRWSEVAPLPVALDDVAATPLPGDRAMVAGAASSWGPTTLEIYDAHADAWRAVPRMPQPQLGSSSLTALPDGRVLVVGATDLGAVSEIYDPAQDTWAWAAQPGQGRDPWLPGSAALSDGRVLTAGGDSGTWTNTEIYDPASNLWTYGAQVESPSGGLAPLAGDKVLLTGEWSGQPDLVYDVRSGATWQTPADPLPSEAPAAATLADGRVLVAGGGILQNGRYVESATSEIFTPPPSYPAATVNPYGYEVIDGQPFVGSVLTVASNSGPATIQWQRCTSSCVDVGSPASDSSSYTLGVDDVGARLRAELTIRAGATTYTTDTQTTAAVQWPDLRLTWSLGAPGGAPGGVEIVRDGTSAPASARLDVVPQTAQPFPLVAPMSGIVAFAAGQPETTFSVPIEDHGVPLLVREFGIALSSPSGAILGQPSALLLHSCWQLVMTCGPDTARDPLNPLALPARPPAGDPLIGANFFIDAWQSPAALAARQLAAGDPRSAERLATIIRQPDTTRFGTWDGDYPGPAVSDFLTRAGRQEPGTVPMLATYKLVSGHCGHWADPPATQAAYHSWILNLAEGIAARPAVLFLEMDSLITMPCLSRQGKAVRLAELHDAINVLSDVPHLVTYLDAGAADALPARVTARYLRQAGVAQIQGFFLNSTHFDWTRKEIAFGERVSRLTGGKHFVINTAENGRGPLVPRHRWKQGNEILCDPRGRGLGPVPTWNTGYPNVDAFAWIANPGVSGGTCRPGAPRSGTFWPALALELVRHADFRVR